MASDSPAPDVTSPHSPRRDPTTFPPAGVGLGATVGPYKLLDQIGEGGMGVVYLAEQPSLKRQVALKLIRPEHLYFPRAKERFRREVEAIARLQHPGIVPVYCVGDEQDPFGLAAVVALAARRPGVGDRTDPHWRWFRCALAIHAAPPMHSSAPSAGSS